MASSDTTPEAILRKYPETRRGSINQVSRGRTRFWGPAALPGSFSLQRRPLVSYDTEDMPRNDAEYEELLEKQGSLDSDTESSSPDPIHRAAKTARWIPFSRRTRKPSSRPNDEHERRVPALLLWLAAAVTIVACTDLAALAYTARMFRTVFQDKHFAAHLEYASPYIGLKELYASGLVNASHIDPILVRPRVSAQVFVDDPDRPAPRGEHDYWSDTWGRLSPNERHLHVTPKVHTIVQFRAIDFGMEDCHLVLTLPAPGATLEAHATFAMHPASPRFDVFRLDAPRPLDVAALTYRTRPHAAERVAAGLRAQVGADTLVHRFPCAWSSLHVFEVACAESEEECLLDVWSSQNTTFGVNIYQHQTV